MKKFLFSLIFLGIFCGAAAAADIVYSTANGGLGLIKISSATSFDLQSNKYSGGNANSLIYSYWENNTSNGEGTSRLIFITPVTDTTQSGDTAIRFNPSDLSKSIDEKAIVLNGIYGTKYMAKSDSGGSIYLASSSDVHKYSTASFTNEKTYQHPSNDLAPNPEVKGLLTTGARVYVLIARHRTESKDIIMDFDGQISTGVKSVGAREVTSASKTIALTRDSRLVLGHEKGADIVSGGTSTKVVSTDHPVVSICSDNSNGFYYVVQETSNDVKLNSLYHYKDSNTAVTSMLTNITGGNVQVFHADHDVLAAVIGGEIKLYNMANDNLVTTYTASQLGGTPYNITSCTTTGDSASSSSGCNLIRNEELGVRTFLILLLFVLGLSVKRVRNS